MVHTPSVTVKAERIETVRGDVPAGFGWLLHVAHSESTFVSEYVSEQGCRLLFYHRKIL